MGKMDSSDRCEHKCTESNRSCCFNFVKKIYIKIELKLNDGVFVIPAEIDAVVELVLLLSLVTATTLTQINGPTHEQKSWHDDRKDFLDPG